jgi:2,3-bisphosphoglycerate-independent phosphoglycerate mutase
MGSDGTAAFGERAAAEGVLGTMMGVDIVPQLVELLRSS